jgi:ParB family chromosome partitioning protein
MNASSKKSAALDFRDAERRTTKRRKRKVREEKAPLVKAAPPNRVRVGKVIVPQHKQKLDDNVVNEIAESFAVSGGEPFSPIAVRRVEKDVAGDKGTKIVLVAGAHRLAAAKRAELEYIDCVYIEGDDDTAKLIELGEDLWRKNLTVLRRAEILTEWVSLAEKKLRVSGQDVPKGKVGRPLGRLTKAAQGLPVFGRSVEARRKELDRASKIAGISDEAKGAAMIGGLANNQTALSEIARASTAKAQLKKAVEISSRVRDAIVEPKANEGEAKGEAIPETHKEDGENVVKGDAGNPDGDKKEKDGVENPVEATTFEALEAAWKRECRKLWKYAPNDVRYEFVGMLKRVRCYATTDVVSFIHDIFMGRGSVDCEDLYAFAGAKGLAKAPVRKALKELSYVRKKRKGSGARGSVYYKNKDADWKNQIPVFKDPEIKAASAALMANEKTEQELPPIRPGDEGYYEI